MIRPFLSRQFLRFLVTGGVAAGANFLSRIVYDLWLSYSTSIILAYITGMIVAFLLARVFVFQNPSQALHQSLLFFILVNLAAVLQTWGVAMGLSHFLLPAVGVTSFVPEISHAVGIVVPVFSSYLGHRRWSFR